MWLFMRVAASSGVPTSSLKDAPIILSDIVLKPSSLPGFRIKFSWADTCDLLTEPLTGP